MIGHRQDIERDQRQYDRYPGIDVLRSAMHFQHDRRQTERRLSSIAESNERNKSRAET
jgi:hypothetical protein